MLHEPIIGLEIHAELRTKTKMFCDSPNVPDEKHPNINICPVCMGHPGTLPVVNREAVRHVLRVGYAVGGEIVSLSKFDRKNYFYPDLPKGYQISQYDLPLVKNGFLAVNGRDIRIRRVHLEEDTGRLQHAPDRTNSLVDFNRAGIPLMELVSEPDIRSGKEARKFCEEFQLILQYLGASDANMEKGEMRCEVNISLRQDADKRGGTDDLRGSKTDQRESSQRESVLADQRESAPLGTKAEIKNLNSFRAVERAIDYEIQRQTELLNKGKEVLQETRGWDERRGETFSQRVKEEAHDYRYFPEPDLPPLRIQPPEFDLEKIRRSLPELPRAKRQRFEKEFGLPAMDAEIFVRAKGLADYYEAVVSELVRWMRDAAPGQKIYKKTLSKTAANYCITELQKLLRENDVRIEFIRITPENFAELVKMISRKEISSSGAQTILGEMFHSGGDPCAIADRKNVRQVSDVSLLGSVIEKAVAENPKSVEDYKNGKSNVLQFLVGKVMKETRGSANPEEVQRLLKERMSR